MAKIREWLIYQRIVRARRRADRRALRRERAARRLERGGDTTDMGFTGVGKGDRSEGGYFGP